MKPLCIDLFCGLGGWAEGFLGDGYDVIGVDVERHDYGTGGYPGQLVLQDVTTLHGAQFSGAACIVASPPCTEFSYMAMPFSRGKQIAAALRGEGEFPEPYTGSRTVSELRALFDACFRIQQQAIMATAKPCPACGHKGFVVTYNDQTIPCDRCYGEGFVTRHIPIVVENVKGAQPWVGRAKAHYGSFYLWGDVHDVGGRVVIGEPSITNTGIRAARATKNPGQDWSRFAKTGEVSPHWNVSGCFQAGHVNKRDGHSHTRHLTNPVESAIARKRPVWFNDDKRGGQKNGGDWFGAGEDCSLMRSMGSKSLARKQASAMIAKIPFPLAQYAARALRPYLTNITEGSGAGGSGAEPVHRTRQ